MSVQSVDLIQAAQAKQDLAKILDRFMDHLTVSELANVAGCPEHFICSLYALGWNRGFVCGRKQGNIEKQ